MCVWKWLLDQKIQSIIFTRQIIYDNAWYVGSNENQDVKVKLMNRNGLNLI